MRDLRGSLHRQHRRRDLLLGRPREAALGRWGRLQTPGPLRPHPAQPGRRHPGRRTLQRRPVPEAPAGRPHARPAPLPGRIEAKGPDADLDTIARSEQVRRYARHYGLLLLTNYRQFRLIALDAAGEPVSAKSHTLAERDHDFWMAALHHRHTAALHAGSLTEFLRRVMLRPELRLLGSIQRLPGLLSPEPDLRLTVGWGHAGQGGVCMPGQGRPYRREYQQPEMAAFQHGAAALGISRQTLLSLLGDSTLDIYLNAETYWSNVPSRVWSYTIGGYQVIKKWLSYREHSLLGRPLKPEEARHVTAMVRRIAALLRLEPDLDANYQRVKAAPFEWNPGS